MARPSGAEERVLPVGGHHRTELHLAGVDRVADVDALPAFVALEKLAPFGRHGARISGALLVAIGVWRLVSA